MTTRTRTGTDQHTPPRWQHHLPTAIDAIVASMAERHRHAECRTDAVLALADALDASAAWYASRPGAVTITVTDLAEAATRLRAIAGARVAEAAR